DYSKTPESLVPQREYSAMSFDAVNKVFHDGRVFSSKPYNQTIGLFIGPSILAMDGQQHRDHRNLVSAAFKSKALARWEPTIVRPVCNALIDALTTVQRFTTEDTEVEGVEIPARSVINVCIGSANRDEGRWDRSEAFDIFRKHTPHIS